MRVASAGFAALLLAGCANGARHAQVAAQDDLSGLQTVPTQVRTNGTGPAVSALAVTGTITNAERQTLKCSSIEFFVVDKSGNAVAPVAKYCDVPILPHGSSGYFSATFQTQETGGLQLRLEHADGTYEAHELAVTPVRQ